MTDPRSKMRRLLEEPSSDFERALLESSAVDRSDVGACDRALAGLGLGTVAVAATPGAAATAGAAPGAGGGTAAGGAAGTGAGAATAAGAGTGAAVAMAKGGGMLAAKWVAIAVFGGAVAVGSARLSGHGAAARGSPGNPDRPPRPALTGVVGGPKSYEALRSAPAGRSAPEPVRGEVSPVASGASPAVGAPAVPSEGARAGHAPEPPPRTEALPALSAAASKPAQLDAEVEALHAVRFAIEQGDATGALARLDAFDARHALSPMAEEATVLRIDSLMLAGRRAEASALGEVFLATYPRSAYGEHVRAKLKSP